MPHNISYVQQNLMAISNPRKLKRYVEENQLTCILNDTQWQRLYEALSQIEWTLDIQRKDLDQEEIDDKRWDNDIYHVLGSWSTIEWLKIRALISEQNGALLGPTVTDNTSLLLEALKNANTPYEMHGKTVTVWGYLRPGICPNWNST